MRLKNRDGRLGQRGVTPHHRPLWYLGMVVCSCKDTLRVLFEKDLEKFHVILYPPQRGYSLNMVHDCYFTKDDIPAKLLGPVQIVESRWEMSSTKASLFQRANVFRQGVSQRRLLASMFKLQEGPLSR
jgi:hypothetical protein